MWIKLGDVMPDVIESIALKMNEFRTLETVRDGRGE